MNVAPHSWEMPTRHHIRDSLVRRADFAGRDADWQVHLVKVPASQWPILWMRPFDDSCDAGFTAFDEYSDQPMFFGARAKLSSLGEELDDIFQNHRFARQFFLNERGELRGAKEKAAHSLVVAGNGSAAWNLAFVHKEVHFPAPWKWSKRMNADFESLSAHDVWARVQESLRDSRGEAAFAREFALLDEDGRSARIQKTARGDFEELRELVRDALFCCSLWDENPATREVHMTVYSLAEVELWESTDTSFTEFKVPPDLLEKVGKLWRYFKPFDRKIARFRCVKETYAEDLFVETARPTAHERIEAMMRLRAWENRKR